MKIDINENIAKLIHSNETLKNDLISIGFIGLDNPLMIKNMANKMSIKRGAKLLGISEIESKLESLGYEVIDSSLDNDVIERQKLIKSYIRRLSDGENIENVRKDFKENFDGVSSSEIMDAEQALLSEGMDKDEVRKLCDVHSSLFHGITENENIKKTYENDVLKYFSNENNNINKALETYNALPVEEKFAESKELKRLLNIHYRKKGDLIYPLLKSKYNKPGPSEVMWGVDYEILKSFSKAIKNKDLDLLENTLARAEEMTYKEENILFPLLEENLSDEDYSNIYNDLSEYDHDINNNQIKTYNKSSKQKDENTEGYIYFSKGRLRVDQLEALLDTMNIEITFVDEEDINSYYNNHNGDKVFKRPKSSLGRDVYSCHPPQAERKVRKIISDLKSGARDKVVVIRDIGGSDYTVTYYGVWDKKGNYKGILETVQNMDFYKSYLKKWNKL
ncbi:Family of uncharacterised function (DUF438) [Anaerococcus octavius]|uniref:Family of uncharacterized function (DUF438) n=1 Tax=Anaerococcus octavius TaxID=54007 RepID=A0A380WTQ4_9FIRM|nr:DUF438 domain-containing protein [Anaerococcus octavius]SUU92427.1 Family of uncharacterised function (DUF438) [Anaerococcus octavius]